MSRRNMPRDFRMISGGPPVQNVATTSARSDATFGIAPLFRRIVFDFCLLCKISYVIK
jgi:hypothetical protein